ncbi:alpha/beta hydrolase [Natronoglomus mannanivorans]|uniref:Alpha/beta hydrolase n=1 Tax=Natronoglomus mannanivorans TaxID=2979990 RepID=A0AAP3E3C1_9EURY|nr:alpha/beta hydrolase [Halobacteria archaeon AArc-xg1-1]
MPWATNDDDGVTIYYERDGDDDRASEAVVLVQGLGYGRWMWRWQREALRDEFGVIAPDNRGTGRSDVGISGLLRKLPKRIRSPLLTGRFSYTIDEMAADLEAVLDDAGIREAHVVGASMGGMIAQRYALEYTRAKSLTLCCTTHGGPDAVPMPAETRETLFETPDGSERERLRHRMRPAFNDRFTNRNPHLMDRIIEWRLEQDASEPAQEAQLGAASSFDVSDRLGRLRIPTLILHGTDDRIVPVENARLLQEKIPDSRMEIVDGGSHMFFLEDDDVVNDHLREFLLEDERVVQ